LQQFIDSLYDPSLDIPKAPFYEAESDMGNKEYKLKFAEFTAFKLQKRRAQMEHRLREGEGKAFYNIGVGDDGEAIGLEADELLYTTHFLAYIA
jgi:GTPase